MLQISMSVLRIEMDVNRSVQIPLAHTTADVLWDIVSIQTVGHALVIMLS